MNDYNAVAAFARGHFRHFNAAALVDAADAYRDHMESGGKMMVTLAGAMSTAELGVSLAEMIRRGKVDAISCTGANLEEDLFNLVAHDEYVRVPGYRYLSAEEEAELHARQLNRVTDTCIPEDEAMRVVEAALLEEWERADRDGERRFPHEYLYRIIRSGAISEHYQIDPKDSWMVAAAERDLPIVVPGWEDSTSGNIYAGHCMKGKLKDIHIAKSGIEYMMELADWYRKESRGAGIGFFQIGGGIAGDFPICVVPMLEQDMRQPTPLWAYFCQISDSTTSYGSYSGAVPNEKITWGKIGPETPSFVIESDASIVAPIFFALVMAD